MHAIVLAVSVLAGPYSDISAPLTVKGGQFLNVSCLSPFSFDPVDTDGWRFLTLRLRISRLSSTAVSMVCSHGDSPSTAHHRIPVEKYSGDVATSGQKIWRWNPTVSDSWSWTINLWGYRWTSCAITCTNPSINDRISATGVLGVGE